MPHGVGDFVARRAALLFTVASMTSLIDAVPENVRRSPSISGLTNKRRVEFVDVILVHHGVVKAAKRGGDLLRQARGLLIVEQPRQDESEQTRPPPRSREAAILCLTSLRLGPSSLAASSPWLASARSVE